MPKKELQNNKKHEEDMMTMTMTMLFSDDDTY